MDQPPIIETRTPPKITPLHQKKNQSDVFLIFLSGVVLAVVVIALLESSKRTQESPLKSQDQGPKSLHLLAEAEKDFQNKEFSLAREKANTFLNLNPQFQTTNEALAIVEKSSKALEADELALKAYGELTIKKLSSRYDEFEKVTWYTPQFATDDKDCVYFYIGRNQSGATWLRLRILFKDTSWLFINRFLFQSSGKIYEIPCGFGEVKREALYSGIREWIDVSADQFPKLVKHITTTQTAWQLRCQGENRNYDRSLSAEEIQGFKDVWAAFYALGGRF